MLRRLIPAFALAATAACGGQSHTVKPEQGAQPAKAAAPEKTEPEKTAPAPVKIAPHFAEGNGEVIMLPTPGSAEVAVRVLFYTGSTDDPPGMEGLTSVTARLMAEGGTQRMTYPEILRALYPLSAEIDVSVDKEQTVFSGKVHVDHLARFLPILAEVIKSPRLPEADFARLRQDNLNAIEKRLRATDDENLGKEMLGLMLYGADHPYGHYNGGSVKGLTAIKLDDVKAHAAKVFGKRRMLIGIAGAVDAKTKSMVESAFAGLSEGAPRLAEIPAVAKPARPEVLIAEKPGKATAISIGYTHEAFRGHPDWPALALTQSYFGEHRQFHGVLMQEIREKRGMNYGDYAYVEKFIQEGGSRLVRTNIARRQQQFEIWIRPVDPKDAVFAVRLAMFFLDRLMTGGVPDSGVAQMKDFLAGYTRLWDLTPMRKLGYALDDQFYGTSNYLESYRGALAKLTPAEVNAALKRNLVAWPVKIAIVAPDAQALKAQLLSGAKSEKKYDGNVDPAVLELDKAVSVFPLKLTEADIKTVKVDELFVDRSK